MTPPLAAPQTARGLGTHIADRVPNLQCKSDLIPNTTETPRANNVSSDSSLSTRSFMFPNSARDRAFYVESEPRVPNVESLVFTPQKYAIRPDRDLKPGLRAYLDY